MAIRLLHSSEYLLLAGASALAIVATPTAAIATDDEIVVTGTYVRKAQSKSSPIIEIGEEEFQNALAPSIAEFFRDLPITSGSIVLGNAEDGGQSPTASINLRGVGPRGTLVLLNGIRQTVGAIPTDDGILAVDVNALVPPIMLSRVDVLKDGASALYGSDAVAGVVNFVTRDNFEGVELSFDYDWIENAGVGAKDFGALIGSQGERGGIVASFQYYDRDRLEIEDLLGLEQIEDFGSISSFGNPGSFTLVRPGPNDIQVPDPLCGDPSLGEPAFASLTGGPVGGGLAPGGATCRLNVALGRSIAASSRRLVGLTRAFYDISDSIRATGEFGYSRIRASRSSAFSPPLTTGVFTVPAANPGNPFGEDALFRGRVRGPFHGDPVDTDIRSDTWRVSGGISGDLASTQWRWRATALYSRNDSTASRPDSVSANLQLGLDGLAGFGCDPASGTPGVDECLYYNPFANSLLAAPGDAQFNDPEVFDFILGDQVQQSSSTLGVVEAVVDGSVGPIGLALGYQFRTEDFENDFDDLSNFGAFTFFARGFDYSFSRNVHAGFVELVAPVGGFAEIQAAGRYEAFEGGDSTFDPKVGVAVTPFEGLKLRGTWGTSFRQPGPVQINGVFQAAANIATPTGRITSTATTRGDPDLRPEEATVFTGGFDYDRNFGSSNVSLSVDYWNISFTDLIVEPTPESIFFTDPTDPRIIFDGFCTVGVNCLPSNVTGFDISFVNAASLDTSGIDITLKLRHETQSLGAVELSAMVTQTLAYDIVEVAGGPSIDGVGQINTTNLGSPIAATRGAFSAQWTVGAHSLRGGAHYISGVEDQSSTLSESDAFLTFDLSYRFDWENAPAGPVSLTLGVVNLGDAQPPAIANTNTTVNTLLHDPRGRIFRAGIRKSF